ncbi:hypothetical protein BO94DRAFT_551683 [Aspergillus sclerotioniger CBS 115572]|uniref:Uncharacterized protein n=1 Tax=Aspergillus sclerotioniger CBS 115572 TaxID=1450535 RepID=A0A317UW58_9EURO|nr:hypothetical protein BO94DRAFT_551683 [Aspergillus sclerotioniger CBS 115572]PWY65631.1 hypothetical protein BO94DRAFT_551683 [Aspergillus sclerotioniger CBS 115572]
MLNLRIEIESLVGLKPRDTQSLNGQWNKSEGFNKFIDYLNLTDGPRIIKHGPASSNAYSWSMQLDESLSGDGSCTVIIRFPDMFVNEDSNWREDVRSFWAKLNNACEFVFVNTLPKQKVTIRPLEPSVGISQFKAWAHAWIHFFETNMMMAGMKKDVFKMSPEEKGGLSQQTGRLLEDIEKRFPEIYITPNALMYKKLPLWVEYFVWFAKASLSIENTRLFKYQKDIKGLQKFITENVPEADLDLNQVTSEPGCGPVAYLTHNLFTEEVQ